tara:strand:- start:9661 stop:11343 length:1683 start_codon:yes stop_codon:yes gene_type:complete
MEHLIFISYILIIIFSTIGYGFGFSKIINEKYLNLNLGYQGIFGIFLLSILSIVTSFFLKHGYYHNSIVHFIGLFLFFYFTKKIPFKDKKLLFYVFISLLISLYIYKNHDDFPYYHLTYALNLSENGFIIGQGNFGHGWRTSSSLFFFHSILYLPLIEFYLFHSGPFLILLYFNYIVLKKLFYKINLTKFDIVFFFSLFSFTFVNIAFYRISEHGTDRSAQIIVFLIFIKLLEYISNNLNDVKKNNNIDLILILLFFASSFKALYYIYLFIIPVLFYKIIFKIEFIKSLNKKMIFILFISMSLNLSINFFNSGCFLYPEKRTCFNTSWAIPIDEVELMNTHYEWWSKAGGGPGYKHELEKHEYVKNFNWIQNWIQRHFFNKVSDTLFGIIFICTLYFILFKVLSKERNKTKINKNIFLVYIVVFILLLEWFLKHPAMRYGGYVLIALPLFIFFSQVLSRYKLDINKAKKMSIFIIFLVFFIFETRNIIRLNKEINFYKYRPNISPFFKVDKVESKISFKNSDFIVYNPIDNMCWASKTPCAYSDIITSKNKFGFKIILRK